MVVDTITPKYRSEAKIAIEGRENVFLRPEAEKSIDRAAADQEAIATQVQIIQSRDIARQVIRELKLGERPEFDPALNGVSSIGAFLSAFSLGSDRLKMTQEERVMEVYFERLTVSAVETLARHHHRISQRGSRACREGRQRHRRRLYEAAAAGQSRSDAQRQRLSRERDQAAAPDRAGGRCQGRRVSRQGQSLYRQQPDQPEHAATRRTDQPACDRARAEGRPRRAVTRDPRHAEERQVGRVRRYRQFRSAEAAGRAARAAALTTRRAVIRRCWNGIRAFRN